MVFKNNKNLIFLYLILLLQLFILICNNDIQKKIIAVPFKSYYPTINDEDELVKYIGSMIKRKLYWESENENGQTIKVILTLRLSTMHTSDSVGMFYLDESYDYYYKPNSNDICKFNYNNSNNYKCVTPFDKSFHLRSKLCYAKERFKFYEDTQLSKDTINFYDIEFIHTVNNTEICFFDGLQLDNDKKNQELNLFHQLKNNIKSKSYSWMLKFTSADEGLFIFGDIINNNNIHFFKDINTYDNYESVYVKPFSSGTIFWKLNFDSLFLGKNNNATAMYIEVNFDINSQFIRIPDKYFSIIKQKYFADYCSYKYQDGNPICFEKYVFAKFKGIYCKKSEFLKITNDYKILPELTFYSSELHLNITFSPRELFRDYNNTLFFLVGHDTQIEADEWFIGTILLQKYNIVFDPESKQLYLMKYVNKINNENEETTDSNKKIYIAVIVTLLISAIIFGFIGYKYGKKVYQSRKTKANELSDGYDYSSYETNDKNINKLGINNNKEKDLDSQDIDKGINDY